MVAKSLADMTTGDRATVSAIEGRDGLAMRLMEMGLTPGVEVVMVGMAPLGDPFEYRVRGYHLSLRRSEARRVQVTA